MQTPSTPTSHSSSNWSLRCRISSDIDRLDELHQRYHWVPKGDQVRPKPRVLEKKKKRVEDISTYWESSADYILSSVFLKNVTVSGNEKFHVLDKNITNQVRFVPNEFPYDCSANHYILWMGPRPDGSCCFTDDEITGLVLDSLEDIVGSDSCFDFAWYVVLPPLFYRCNEIYTEQVRKPENDHTRY